MIAPFQYMSVRAALWYQGEGEAVDVLPAFLPPCLPASLPSCLPAFLLSCLPFFFIIMSSSPCRALNVSQRTCSHFYKRSDLPLPPIITANADQLTGQYANEDWHTAAYACKLQAMVASWRERKGMGDFAFLNVQLPPSTAAQSITKPTGRQSIRAAAARAVSRSGGLTDISGMAVCVDLGGASAWGVDHPINKDEISRRLALQLVHVAYAKQQDQMPLWTGYVYIYIYIYLNPYPTSISFIHGFTLIGVRGWHPINVLSNSVVSCLCQVLLTCVLYFM